MSMLSLKLRSSRLIQALKLQTKRNLARQMAQLHMVLLEIPQLMELLTQTNTRTMDQDTISIILLLVMVVNTITTTGRVVLVMEAIRVVQEGVMAIVIETVIDKNHFFTYE